MPRHEPSVRRVSWLLLVLVSLAGYRATRLVTTDEISAPLRDRLHREGGRPRLVGFVNCDWCVGVWVCLAAALLVHLGGLVDSWAYVALLWLAAATVVGFLARAEG